MSDPLTIRFERILLGLGSGPAEAASDLIQTAADLARVFEADIGALFVEEQQLFDLTDLPLARALLAAGTSATERPARQLMEAAVRRQGRACRRVLSVLAGAANVRWSFEVARGDPVHLLQRAVGPSDFLVLAGTSGSITGRSLLELARQALATTPAVMVTTAQARYRRGPVAVIGTAAQSPDSLVGFARQVASGLHEELVVLSIEADDTTQFRHGATLRAPLTPAGPGAAMSLPAIRSALRDLKPRLLISQLAITAVSDHTEGFAALMRAAGAPAIFLSGERFRPES